MAAFRKNSILVSVTFNKLIKLADRTEAVVSCMFTVKMTAYWRPSSDHNDSRYDHSPPLS